MSKTIFDIASEVGSGITPLRSNDKYWESDDIPWVKTEQLGEYQIFEANEYISQTALEETTIKLWPEKTVSVAMYGEGKTRGSVSMLMMPTTTNQACCNIVVDSQKADYRFLYYWLKNNYEQLRLLAAGVRKNLNSDDIKSFAFPDYDIEEQYDIAEILSSIDDKIWCNNRINDNLEQQAKLLYDYWFTQFDFPDENGKPYRSSGGEMVWNEELKREIPKGWEVNNIQKFCSIIDCLHSQKPELTFEKEEYYLLQLENLVDSGLVDLKSKYYVSKDMYNLWTSRIQVKDGDLVVTNAGRVGDVSRIPAHVVSGIGRNMTAVRPESIPVFYLYYFFKSPDFAIQMRSNTDSGAFFGSLNVRGIKQLLLTTPPANYNVLKNFNFLVEPMRRKIERLQLENEELRKLRDWLLPMLMNGQATVE